MKTKKRDIDVDMAIARATRVLVDAEVEFCIAGLDDANKLSTAMSAGFTAKVGLTKYNGNVENDDDAEFRFQFLVAMLQRVASTLSDIEREHRIRHGEPIIDGFD
jgi:hypothetical protein